MCVVFTFHKSTVGHIVVKVSNLPMLYTLKTLTYLLLKLCDENLLLAA